MTLPPAIIVHGLPHALTALAPGRPVTLLSAPGAASYAGCAWWRAVVAAALAACPGATAPDALDCADAAGRALEAMSVGCRWIGLASAPPALDLGRRGADRHLAAWLAG